MIRIWEKYVFFVAAFLVFGASLAFGQTPPTASEAAAYKGLHAAAWNNDIAQLDKLLAGGANPNARDGAARTPLHVAAFLCRQDMVELLLKSGANAGLKNRRGETPVDVVSGEWTEGIAVFYQGLSDSAGLNLDLKEIQEMRPKIAALLLRHQESEKGD